MAMGVVVPRRSIFCRAIPRAIKMEGAVIADNRYEPKGVWVYREGLDWEFERFDTIDKAVQYALESKADVKIICRGKEIKYNKITQDRAYFIDFDNKVKLVEI